MNRAYSFLEVKAVSEGTRTITGMATTPSVDRVGDVVESLGVTYKNPLPLLWQHEHDKPIGLVEFGKPTAKGVPFTAVLPRIEEPGVLQDRIEEAWQSIKAGLVRAVSIGFRSLESEQIAGSWGTRYIRTEVFELSAVTIPAQAEARIETVKSFDVGLPAASGKKEIPIVRLTKPAGASAPVKKKLPVVPKPEEGQDMKFAEQIKSFQAALEQKSARQTELMEKAGEEGRSLDAAESEEFDTLSDEISATDTHIKRLETMEKSAIANAKPVTDVSGMQERGQRSAAIVKSVKNEEPGIGFAKFALAMYAGKGDVSSAKAFAEHKFSDDVRLQGIMKAAVAAGTTTDPTWAGNLVELTTLSSEFLNFLRPRTIVGQFGANGVPGLRRVPFNVRIPGKTGSGTAAWVGEGYAKPVTSSAYDATELKWAKIAAISVITEELARFSDPSVQTLVRDDLAEAVIERMDIDFINPAKAAGTGASLSPASITNGVTPIQSTGTDADSIRADIAALWAVADDTNLPTGSAVYITDPKTARMLSLLRNPLGSVEFPGVTMAGGSIDSVPLIVSNYVPSDSGGSMFILAFASEIYLADDGVVTVDISREASILMDSAPVMNSGTPTGSAQLVSMFQTNSMAIRAERYVNWAKRRPQAVAYLDNVNWGA